MLETSRKESIGTKGPNWPVFIYLNKIGKNNNIKDKKNREQFIDYDDQWDPQTETYDTGLTHRLVLLITNLIFIYS